MDVEVAKVSSKGQVVIPGSIREQLGIKASDKFLVFCAEDTIIFKKITPSVLKRSFEEITAPLAKRAKELGLTEDDVESTVQRFRKEKKR